MREAGSCGIRSMTPPTSTSAFMAISSAVPQLTRADARGQGIWGATGSFGGVPRGSRAESARFRIKRGKSNIKRGHIWRKVLAFGSKRGKSTSKKKKIEENRRILPNLDDFDPKSSEMLLLFFAERARARINDVRALPLGRLVSNPRCVRAGLRI